MQASERREVRQRGEQENSHNRTGDIDGGNKQGEERRERREKKWGREIAKTKRHVHPATQREATARHRQLTLESKRRQASLCFCWRSFILALFLAVSTTSFSFCISRFLVSSPSVVSSFSTPPLDPSLISFLSRLLVLLFMLFFSSCCCPSLPVVLLCLSSFSSLFSLLFIKLLRCRLLATRRSEQEVAHGRKPGNFDLERSFRPATVEIAKGRRC
ncbi:UNVERIFIED_CONTAM: transmembrane protein, putative [Hammondia hammondi]|eukprot:XP_008886736.1 transmembrane protein, putative [Hammondia hammondi]